MTAFNNNIEINEFYNFKFIKLPDNKIKGGVQFQAYESFYNVQVKGILSYTQALRFGDFTQYLSNTLPNILKDTNILNTSSLSTSQANSIITKAIEGYTYVLIDKENVESLIPKDLIFGVELVSTLDVLLTVNNLTCKDFANIINVLSSNGYNVSYIEG